MSTPTAAERRVALCSVRGALQVLHNAANLVKLVDVDAERMLRTAEGLARSSVTRVEFVNRSAAAATFAAAAEVASSPGDPAPAARPLSRKKNRQKKKKAITSMAVDGGSGGSAGHVSVGGAESPAAAVVLSCDAAPFVPRRVLVARSSRERSPRRAADVTASSSSPPFKVWPSPKG